MSARLGIRTRTFLIAGILAAGAMPSAVHAQDAHYWTYQYGTRSNLLGGAVVGSVKAART